ncbi:MAG TPA: peptidoglycan editing factor PgeF [Acidobacteriaceae bacterium]|nr:peptidoglycan editing factor PgeF [Acidobacteriaceae bacterium]
MAAKTTLKSDQIRIRELDALFQRGGLTRSPHKKRIAASHGKTGSNKTSQAAKKRTGRAIIPTKKPRKQVPGPDILRVPQWQAYDWLLHGFSTRGGGVSTAYQAGNKGQSCGELNLGLTAPDSAENVKRNRELFVGALLRGPDDTSKSGRTKAPQLRLLRQIHSGLVRRTDAEINSATAEPLRGDGWIASKAGELLGIQTADCIPVLVVDVRQRIVAAFHAGWRGTLARIVERGVGRLRAEFGSQPSDLTAAIGPGIGSCCYSVGEEVRMEFASQFSYADTLFKEVFDLDPIKEKYPMLFLTARAPGHSNLGPSLHLDLVEANRRQLMDAGIAPDKIFALNLCTACDTSRFFSYRAEQGFTGRMVSAIGIRA